MSPDSPKGNSTVWTELLPDYSPADDTPDYTPEPRPDEERLEINRRVSQEESGVYITQNRLLTLALSKQSPGCKQPTYGRGACVQGMITLKKTEGIMSVEAKVSF
ncbi:MAG TPA: hypothetical protein VGO47_11070, partial [Chlamydiales bacterium]|nr:hypothetical protein [Chlamydiales bacterium]